MKKLKFITASAAIAALTLTACQNDVDFTQEDAQNAAAAAAALDDNAIQFGTYLNQNLATRAGWAGSIDNNRLKDLNAAGTAHEASTNGFGVFAYYTKTKGYADYNRYSGGTVADEAANFMFNQQVKWNNDLGDSYITKWEYSPLKYWPNEVQGTTMNYVWSAIATPDPVPALYKQGTGISSSIVGEIGDYFLRTTDSKWFQLTAIIPNNYATGVDDQENDANGNNAYTDYTNGGNVSFFAYAPYVEFPVTGDEGVIKINGYTTINDASDDANEATTDPILTYVVAKEGKNVVDLLWGTRGSTSLNVKDGADPSVEGTSTTPTPVTPKATYVNSLLKPYHTNIDLTKQKTNGTIDFAFKHATAKVGGSTTNTSSTTPTPDNIKNGLMIVLDLDDQKGAETGGSKDATTKVTVKSINIAARTLIADPSDASKTPGKNTYTTSYYLKNAQGDFNLATGKWSVYLGETGANENVQNVATLPTNHLINQAGDGTAAGQLNATIVEVDGYDWKTNWNTAVAGVETTAKNVYANEAYPLVFIPGTYPELTVTVDYFVRTKDANLAQGYSEVEQNITKKLTFTSPVELNKQYSLLIHLGLTSVKFTASVSDWELDKDADPANNDFDSDGDGVNDIKVEDVYVPINVSGLIAKAPATVSSNATSFDLTELKYYTTNSKGESVENNVISTAKENVQVVDGTNVDDPTTVGKTLVIAANTTFSDRTETFKVKYTDPSSSIEYLSEPITVIQKGRIAESAKLTFDPDVTASNISKAGGDVAYTSLAVTASGKESDNSTTVTDEAVGASEVGTFVFKDASGNLLTWIKHDKANNKFVVEENETGAARAAKLWISIGGKLVETDKTFTQAAS